MKQTKRQQRQEIVRAFMVGRDWTSPTIIGEEALGLTYDKASAVASPVCQSLVHVGKMERSMQGKYRLVDTES